MQRMSTAQKMIWPAKNHPWILTTLGCSGTPDPRNSSVNRGIPQLRNILTENPRVMGSRTTKGDEHPRVVLGQPEAKLFDDGGTMTEDKDF